MTVLGYIKGTLIFFSLFGVGFLGLGAWKLWSSYTFSRDADKQDGTFKGYHTVYHDDALEDPTSLTDYTGLKHTPRSEEYLPMFTYTDNQGQTHDVTEPKSHFFKHLQYGQKVTVLVPSHSSQPPRLGDLFSLYGDGILLCLLGLGIFMLTYYGIKGSEVLMGPEGIFQRIGQSRFPIGGLFMMILGFLLIAGGMMFLGYRVALKRQNPSLITALQNKQYQRAFRLAGDGWGIDAETPDGEDPLILALKAGQPHVARAILANLFVNGNVRSSEGILAVQMAAHLREPFLLNMLLKKGSMVSEISPSVVHDLIVAGDTKTVQVIVENGYYLNQKYNQLTFGDLALIHGRLDIVRMIYEHKGLFHAPPSFVALAINDTQALTTALRHPGAKAEHFHEFSLKQYAEKIGRMEMIEGIQGTGS